MPGAGSYHRAAPYLNYFAAGRTSIRGYRESRLGPETIIGLGNPYGGEKLSRGQPLGIDLPGARKVEKRRRVSCFYDMGNVFQTAIRSNSWGSTTRRRSTITSIMLT